MRPPVVSLRPYQTAAIEAVRAHYRRGHRAAMLVLATGAGKTFTALSMVRATIERGGRVLWLAHRKELVEQPLRAWVSVPGLAAGAGGVVMGARREVRCPLVCASVQTVGRTPLASDSVLRQIFAEGAPSLIVADECHHYADDGRGMFASLIRSCDALGDAKSPAYWLGLSATPERTDGRGLVGIWGTEPAYVYPFERAIADGYLVPPTIDCQPIELSEEAKAAFEAAKEGEDDRQAARILLDADVVAHTLTHMGRYRGRVAIVFCADIQQSSETLAALKAGGYRAAMVTGTTPKPARGAILRAFEAGNMDVLVNCNVLTEGTDLPRCDMIVAARPFASKVLWIQAVGRGLRLYHGKTDCIVLDLVGASGEHSLVHACALLSGGAARLIREPFRGRLKRKLRRPNGGGYVVPPVILDVRPDGDDGWVATGMLVGDAALAVPFAADIPVKVPQDVARPTTSEDTPGILLPDYCRDRRPIRAHWLNVGEGALVCGLRRQDGLMWLVRLDGGGWMTYLVSPRGRKPRPLGLLPMDEGFASALADDVFRQAGPLVSRNAEWRGFPATERQIEVARKSKLEVTGDTRGDYAEAMTLAKARRFWARHGRDSFAVAIAGGRA